MASNTSSTNNGDNWILKSSADTNYGTQTDLRTGGLPSSDIVYRTLIGFTLPSGTGTITKVSLYLYCHNYYGADDGRDINVHSLSRTDWSETESTWNRYKTSNAWTSVGGDYSATVIHGISAAITSAGWQHWDIMGGDADNPLELDWEDTVNLILKMSVETDGPDGSLNRFFYSKNYTVDTAKRPYLEITYTTTSIKSINSLAKSSCKSYNGLAMSSIKNINGLS